MRTHRSLKVVVAASVGLLATGSTFAWAGVLVGGHRADRIGTFQPVAHRLAPGSQLPPLTTVQSQPRTTTSSIAPGETTGRTTDDNGRDKDD